MMHVLTQLLMMLLCYGLADLVVCFFFRCPMMEAFLCPVRTGNNGFQRNLTVEFSEAGAIRTAFNGN